MDYNFLKLIILLPLINFMIIYNNKEGRLGHQLMHLIILLTYGIKYKRSFYYPSFTKLYLSYFEIPNNAYIKNQPSIFIKLTYPLLKFFKIGHFKILKYEFSLYTEKSKELIFDNEIEKIFTSNRPIVVTDFMMNDTISSLQYIEEIRHQIKISPSIEKNIIIFFKELKYKYKQTIAIHIRKTDFKEFANGRFYFNEIEYKNILDHFIKKMEFNISETAIILCSDEEIDTSVFNNYIIFYKQRSTIDDFVIMKNADYIISTRSIFSSCASLLGQNKIYQIIDLQKDFTKDDILEFTDLMQTEYNLKIRKDNII